MINIQIGGDYIEKEIMHMIHSKTQVTSDEKKNPTKFKSIEDFNPVKKRSSIIN